MGKRIDYLVGGKITLDIGIDKSIIEKLVQLSDQFILKKK